MTTQTEALKALVHEMEYVLSCINEDKIPFDGDDFHEALRLGKEALAVKQEQRSDSEHMGEPVGQLLEDAFGRGQVMWFNKPKDESMLYTTPQPVTESHKRKPLTDEERFQLRCQWNPEIHGAMHDYIIQQTEAAHGIKE